MEEQAESWARFKLESRLCSRKGGTMPTCAQHMCQPLAGRQLHVRKAGRPEGTVCGQLLWKYGYRLSTGHQGVASPAKLHQGEFLSRGSGLTPMAMEAPSLIY